MRQFVRKGNQMKEEKSDPGVTVRFTTWDWLLRWTGAAAALLVRVLEPWALPPGATMSNSSTGSSTSDTPGASAAIAGGSSPEGATAEDSQEEKARPPILGGFPYLYSVLSQGVVNHTLLPETMTDDELIELARVQVTINHTEGCLVLGPDRAVYFQPDGTATFRPVVPQCWRVEIGVLEPPFEFERSSNFERREKLAASYVDMLHEKVGSGWGDSFCGGDLIDPQEAAALRGLNPDGSPKGLRRCDTCGEYRGHCLDPMIAQTRLLLPVYCRCQNFNRCARCGQHLHARRLNGNYYRPQDGLLIYVPGVAAAKHVCVPPYVDLPTISSSATSPSAS